MPWFKIDDEFHSHPKVRRAGNAAVGLWVRCGAWSSQYLTDGHIDAAVARSYGSAAEAGRLSTAGMWVETDAGFWMPDYLDYNPSAEQVRAERAAARARQARRRRNGDGTYT